MIFVLEATPAPCPLEKRFKVMAHVDLTPISKLVMEDMGIDPETLWFSMWEFDNYDCARTRLAVEQVRNGDPRVTFALIDTETVLEVV